MAWLDVLAAELGQAEAEKARLDPQLQQQHQRVEEAEYEQRRLEYLIDELLERRRRNVIKLNDALDCQCDVQFELRGVERTIKHTTELIKRKNRMNLFKFPPEILDKILELVLVETHPINLSEYRSSQLHLGILGTNKEMEALSRAVFYGRNTFKVNSAKINDRSCYGDSNSWPMAPPMQSIRLLQLHIDKKTDIPSLLKLLEGCKSLERLAIILKSAPRNYIKQFGSLNYQRPSRLESVIVEIPPARVHQEDLKIAGKQLLEIFAKH